MASSILTMPTQDFSQRKEFVTIKNWRQRLICHKHYYSAALAQALSDSEALLQNNSIQYLKQGDTTTVALLELDGHRLVVKRYNLLNLPHRLRRSLRPTRAWISWCYAHYLLQLGIATPQPVAMLEQRFGPFHGTAYYICEYVEGVSAFDFFTKNSLQNNLDKLAVQKTIVTLLKNLAQAHLAHGDMKATNILINQDKLQPYLIDLDAMRYIHNQRRWLRAKQRDWRRFMLNWQKHPEIYAAFAADLNDF
jgi:serine/threonine protein kinase